MKNYILGGLLAVTLFSLVGCQEPATPPENHIVEENKGGFAEPEPTNWVKYTNPIREYMYYRTQAVLNNDINILWNQYPKLKENTDHEKGINVEKYELESLNASFKLIDANFNVEGYEKIKVKTINDHEVIVLVHGSITYLRNDFDKSGGEYLIEVFLENKDNHWKVVKTDEYTLPEYKEWMEGKGE